MRAGPRRLARRLRADGEHGLDVARLDRVVHQARAVGPLLAAAAPRGRARCSAPPRERGQAALDRAPRQLVAEAEMPSGRTSSTPASSASASASMRSPSRARGELEPDPRGHDRELLERLAAGGVEAARRARAPPRRRWPGTASAGEASTSVTKNGLPPVTRCTASASAPVLAASRRDRGARQRRQREPVHRAPGERAEQALQRVRRAELVVAEGQDEHRGQRLDPPRHVAEHVERRVVGPVDVLDDEHGRRRGRELGQDRGEDAVDGPAVGERRRQRAAGLRARRRAAGRACAARSGRRTPTAARARGRPPRARRRAPRSSCRSRPRR